MRRYFYRAALLAIFATAFLASSGISSETTYTYDSKHRHILEGNIPILWDGQHELGHPNYYRILGRTPLAEIGSAIAADTQILQPLHTALGDLFHLEGRSQSFTAFGEGTPDTRWGYRSKVHDPSGLIYFGRRYYDPNSGRFITPDPEGYLDSQNLYAYTLNNPLSNQDPYGLFAAYATTPEFYPQYAERPTFDPDAWKIVGTALYHRALSYGRDAALFSGRCFGGIHGMDDMSFADTYAAHRGAGDLFIESTNNWMASSAYAGSGLYEVARSSSYMATDLAMTPLLPLGKIKAATAIGKGVKLASRASRAAPLNKTLLKSRAVTGKVFKSNGQSAKNAVRPIWTSR